MSDIQQKAATFADQWGFKGGDKELFIRIIVLSSQSKLSNEFLDKQGVTSDSEMGRATLAFWETLTGKTVAEIKPLKQQMEEFAIQHNLSIEDSMLLQMLVVLSMAKNADGVTALGKHFGVNRDSQVFKLAIEFLSTR